MPITSHTLPVPDRMVRRIIEEEVAMPKKPTLADAE